MKDKEKQIEEMRIQRKLEMTKDISNGISGVLAYEIQKLAEHLISLNYVKLSKDSVVLSKEEYEKQNDYIANLRCIITDLENQCAEASKETAEKIIKWFKENSICIPSDEYINEFAKQFSVEIKEK